MNFLNELFIEEIQFYKELTEKFDLYKCQVCGNVVQVLLNGVGQLVCCEQPMTNMVPREETGNELAEKHTPVVEQEEDKRFVRLRMHPMSEEHYIPFIEVYTKDKKNLHLKSHWKQKKIWWQEKHLNFVKSILKLIVV